jgi:hypothetical protein
MPIALGVLTIFYDGLVPSLTEIGWGGAEILAGFAAMGGVYVARFNPAPGGTLIAAGLAAMVPLAFWALPGTIVIGAILVACAAGRHLAPAPESPLPA